MLDPSAAVATARARPPTWPPHCRRRARPVRRPARRPAEAPSPPRPPGRRGHTPPAHLARSTLTRLARPATARDSPTAPRSPARTTRGLDPAPPHARLRLPEASTAPLGRPRPLSATTMRVRGHGTLAGPRPRRRLQPHVVRRHINCAKRHSSCAEISTVAAPSCTRSRLAPSHPSF